MVGLDNKLSILRGDTIAVSEFLVVRQPTLGEIAEYGDAAYYSMISSLCATPTDYMVFLEDQVGVAYETFPELMLFALIIKSLSVQDTRILLGELDLSTFSIGSEKDGSVVLRNAEGQTINDAMYQFFMRTLRTMHGIQKNVKIPGNAAAKKYNLYQARRAADRQKAKGNEPTDVLTPLICSMVNAEQFKYDYKTVFQLTLFQFNNSIKCVQRVKSYDNIMHGIYAGTVDAKSIPKRELTWLGEA